VRGGGGREGSNQEKKTNRGGGGKAARPTKNTEKKEKPFGGVVRSPGGIQVLEGGAENTEWSFLNESAWAWITCPGGCVHYSRGFSQKPKNREGKCEYKKGRKKSFHIGKKRNNVGCVAGKRGLCWRAGQIKKTGAFNLRGDLNGGKIL